MARCLILAIGPTTVLDLLDYANNGLLVTLKDTGAPAVREVIQDIPTMDGTEDYTAYFSQRVVQMQGVAGPMKVIGVSTGSPWPRQQALDKLMPFLNPKARCTLTWADDDNAQVRVITGLRSSQWATTMDNPTTYNWQIQWKADPVVLGAITNQSSVGLYATTIIGRTYSRTYPRVYITSFGSQTLGLITNGGTYSTWPLYRLFGPITNPVVSILDAATSAVISTIRFIGITVNGGDYLEVNPKNRTVMLNGTSTRYSYLDFVNSIWQPIPVGQSYVQYSGSNGQDPAQAQVFWQDAFL